VGAFSRRCAPSSSLFGVTLPRSADCIDASPSGARPGICHLPLRQRNAFAHLANAARRRNAVVVRITPNDKNNPPGKLADAEVHFTEGELEGMKLIGFAVWERRTGGGRNVTFPARQYSVNGERRTFALLRPTNGDATKQDRIREMVLRAYAAFAEGAESEA
jgi:hypothetical protein